MSSQSWRNFVITKRPQLKGCPFCGAEPEQIEENHIKDVSTQEVVCVIQCHRCGNRTNGYKNVLEAYKAWNRRVGD